MQKLAQEVYNIGYIRHSVSQINQYHRRHDANVAMEEHRARKLLNKKRKLLEIEIYLKAWIPQ